MEFPLLHPKLRGFVNLLALLERCSAGACTMIAMVMEPLKQLHWSQRNGWEHGLVVTMKILRTNCLFSGLRLMGRMGLGCLASTEPAQPRLASHSAISGSHLQERH